MAREEERENGEADGCGKGGRGARANGDSP